MDRVRPPGQPLRLGYHTVLHHYQRDRMNRTPLAMFPRASPPPGLFSSFPLPPLLGGGRLRPVYTQSTDSIETIYRQPAESLQTSYNTNSRQSVDSPQTNFTLQTVYRQSVCRLSVNRLLRPAPCALRPATCTLRPVPSALVLLSVDCMPVVCRPCLY